MRDSELSDEFRETAASLAISALEFELEREINAFRLEPRAWPAYDGPVQPEPEPEEDELPEDSDEPNDDRTQPREVIVAEPVPELSLEWVAAIDRYIELDLNPEDDPTRQGAYAFAAAQLFHSYKDYENSRPRLIAILDDYCGADQTGFAGVLLIVSYQEAGDFENMEFWANELDRREECVSIPEEFATLLEEEIDRFRMGAVAENAERLVNEERYEEAAQEYVRLANEWEGTDNAPLGLFNAGLIYEQNLDKYELAMRQFDRIVQEYPESEYLDDALVRIAVNSKKFFDFERAISTFEALHEMDYTSELVEYPLLDAAELMQFSQRYSDAAEAYQVFLDNFPNDPRAPRVTYTIANLYRDDGDMRNALRYYEEFRNEYGNAVSDLIDIDAAVIESLRIAAEYHAERGETRTANRFRDQIVEEFTVRQPQNPEAAYAAAQVVYERAYASFDDWNAIEMGRGARGAAGSTRRSPQRH